MTVRRSLVLLVALLAGAAALLLALSGGPERSVIGTGTGDVMADANEALRELGEQHGVESREDLMRVNATVETRIGPESQHELSRAARQRARLARANARAADPIPGTGGKWAPYGDGPLQADDPTYPAGSADGFGRVNGRVNDLLWVPQTKRLYAAVAQGGLWESTDLAKSWHPIADNLPAISTGAVAYTPARGRTLIVATGDIAYSNNYGGVGVFWSTDDGKSWKKATGAPDGALSFRLAVDPTNPEVVYYASGFGLYRSTDAGRSFVNVALPTGECAGDSFKPNCFYANMVTDVVVQAKDDFGHKGGAVLAAVGWRNGRRPNFAGKPEAPANGLYTSETGAPGSFAQVPDSSGFTPSERAGRIELGGVDGPGQNSGYVYGVAQDAVIFTNSLAGEQDVPLVGTPSVLDGVYVSADFGKTWTKMESREEFYNPSNGSSLAQLTAAGIAPGYQVTYNIFIEADPTRHLNGVPTRVVLGMEEVFQNAVPNTPQNGKSSFQTIGTYTSSGGACLVIPEQCGQRQAVAGNTTTHPDQHDAEIVPDDSGGATLVVGNDGGVYTQHAAAGAEFNQLSWGKGANEGFYTLLPYGAAMAKDGTVYAGLQDNGQIKITPDRKIASVYIGDGFFALVNPDDSKIAYGELPNAGTYRSIDGGVSWTDISPAVTDADFVAPLVMDPLDANHILTGGREIAETAAGPDTTSGSWSLVYNLGTRSNPGDAAAKASAEDPHNHITALSVVGDNVYAGFCGSCDPVKLKQRFKNGIATNVGGAAPPKRLTSDGWHIAAARGLPNRTITSVTLDPANPRTVFVTLGQSAARFWAPLGSQGEDASDAGTGHVFKSTDAGESFTDISGNLPKTQATWSVLRGGQLLVATRVGVFASRGTDGGAYAPLGTGLPPVATYSMSLKPGDPNTLLAATYGRGVYTYRFADPPPGCRDATRPVTRFSVRARSAVRSRRLRLRGTASDLACGARATVQRVLVSVRRKAGRRCRYLTSRGRLTRSRSCRRPVYLTAKGTSRWSLTSRRRLARGTYTVTVLAVDAAGNRDRAKKRRNVIRVRVR